MNPPPAELQTEDELRSVARQLERDGETQMAKKYTRRADEAAARYFDVKQLGNHASELPTQSVTQQWQRGAALYRYLLAHGWQPPEKLVHPPMSELAQ